MPILLTIDRIPVCREIRIFTQQKNGLTLHRIGLTGFYCNQSPGSKCHNYDRDQFCVSWAVYSLDGKYSEGQSDVSDFAARCAMAGYSTEMRFNLISGATEIDCVPDRGDCCTMSPT
ncbi:hypothetical protein V1525DRAFT_272711 [Lipomyces kononenkoae]|uniref:Uncharacterized protein n=1 Tax=Lipomyces kononenkoae TaxID=34357 RepID=A0ACC3SUN0_LIPKO